MANWLLAACISERIRAATFKRDKALVAKIALLRRLPTLSRRRRPTIVAAVRRRVDDGFGAEIVACSRPVLDHDLLAEEFSLR